jgi:hypothetical protein
MKNEEMMIRSKSVKKSELRVSNDLKFVVCLLVFISLCNLKAANW